MRDSLERYQLNPTMTDGQILALAAKAWHDHGIILLRLEDMPDSPDRQAVIDAAEELYGKRNDA